MRVLIHKRERTLRLMEGTAELLRARIGLGRNPDGPKTRAGDSRTPEGIYGVCLVKTDGKYGRSLGLSYPNTADARAALQQNAIDTAAFRAVESAALHHRRPPWGTALGGEIYIHEGGSHKDWTQGCIALDPADMDVLFPHAAEISEVEILP